MHCSAHKAYFNPASLPHIRADAAFARSFNAIRDIEFAPENIVTGASFSSQPPPALPPQPPLPLLQIAFDHVVEILLQEGQP